MHRFDGEAQKGTACAYSVVFTMEAERESLWQSQKQEQTGKVGHDGK